LSVHWLEFVMMVSWQEWEVPPEPILPVPPVLPPPPHLAATGSGSGSSSHGAGDSRLEANVPLVVSVSGVLLRCGSCHERR
jgi:hypothetical protein